MKHGTLFLAAMVILFASVVRGDDTQNRIQSTDPVRRLSAVTLTDAVWDQSVDENGNGYTRSRVLQVKMNNSGSTSATMYLKIYYGTPHGIIAEYITTPAFSVYGNPIIIKTTTVEVKIGQPNTEIDYGKYNFRVELWAPLASKPADSMDDTDDTDLKEQLFETAKEDRAAYAIRDAWWLNKTDIDGDGYPRYKKLKFDVDYILSETHKSVFAKVYRKLHSADTYVLYYTTANFGITGTSESDSTGVDVGWPNGVLGEGGMGQGLYDFRIDVYEAGGSEVEVSRGPADDGNLNNQMFEQPGVDDYGSNYAIIGVSDMWGSAVDNDLDGYASYRRMTFDVNVMAIGVTRTIYAKIYVKPSSAGEYDPFTQLYCTTGSFTVTGMSPDDKVSVDIGPPNAELAHDTYRFKIQIWEEGAASAAYSQDNTVNPFLTNKFETTALDPGVFIVRDAWWRNRTDIDGDGWPRYKKLMFDVDYSIPLTAKTVFANVYKKLHSEGLFLFYFKTPSIHISGISESDSTGIDVGWPNDVLGEGGTGQGQYDFRIDIIEVTGSGAIVGGVGPPQDGDLNNQMFEQPGVDDYSSNYAVIGVSDMWGSAVDGDGDGYASYRKMTFDVNVMAIGVTRTVYAKIYTKPSSAAELDPFTNLYTTTPPFTITGMSSDDKVSVDIGPPNAELARDNYRFKIQIWEAGAASAAYSQSNTINPFLQNQFETTAEDGATGVLSFQDGIPAEFALFQNFPNPFNPATTIGYFLPSPSEIRLTVYDTAGREMAVLVQGKQSAGEHRATFDGKGYGSGMYFIRLEAGQAVFTRKMVILK
jgi:hypothetical protein